MHPSGIDVIRLLAARKHPLNGGCREQDPAIECLKSGYPFNRLPFDLRPEWIEKEYAPPFTTIQTQILQVSVGIAPEDLDVARRMSLPDLLQCAAAFPVLLDEDEAIEGFVPDRKSPARGTLDQLAVEADFSGSGKRIDMDQTPTLVLHRRGVAGGGESPSCADVARSAAGEGCGEGPPSPRKPAERIAPAIRAAILWGKRPASARTTGFPTSSRTDSHAGRFIHRLLESRATIWGRGCATRRDASGIPCQNLSPIPGVVVTRGGDRGSRRRRRAAGSARRSAPRSTVPKRSRTLLANGERAKKGRACR